MITCISWQLAGFACLVEASLNMGLDSLGTLKGIRCSGKVVSEVKPSLEQVTHHVAVVLATRNPPPQD